MLPDMETYEMNYKYIDYGDFEQGYIFLIEFLNKLSPSFWTFIILYAVLVTTVSINLQKKYAVMPLFCLLLYVCTSLFSLFLVRQYIAMMLCLLTLPFILNKKIVPFILLTLLATTIHRTAFIWFLMYFLNYAKIDFKTISILFIGSIALVKGLDILIGDIVMYISRVESYITISEEQYTWKPLAVSVAVFVYVIYCYGKDLKQIEGFEKICFFMLLFSILLNAINVIGTSFKALYRIVPYCSLFLPFTLPYATIHIKNPSLKYICVTIISSLYIWLLIAGINQQRGWFGFIF